ncbi:MAG: hypothetical protein EPO13_00535 [Actinomycetota bacterium]|nr:MAG: hypothetical protein EPO13_00535 [Actinomycetota bacterium]
MALTRPLPADMPSLERTEKTDRILFATAALGMLVALVTFFLVASTAPGEDAGDFRTEPKILTVDR